MNIAGNTILITGGGSGIGRGLAEAFHALGNQVIIAGRRQQVLDQTTAANPGMRSVVADLDDAAGVQRLAAQLASEYPALNVLINNAGIMRIEKLREDPLAEAGATITTNLLGPIRLIGALLPSLLKQPRATIMTVSSGLAFVPLAAAPTYCATKAAIHSYSQSLRHQLAGTSVEVVELIPPYVATELLGAHQAQDPNAMPLEKFIAESIEILKTQPGVTEVIVDTAKPLRFVVENGGYDAFFQRLNQSAH